MMPELRRHLGRSLDELVCGIAPADARKIRDESLAYFVGDASPIVRNEKERTLLLRYRLLPAKRRAALLDLIKPAD